MRRRRLPWSGGAVLLALAGGCGQEGPPFHTDFRFAPTPPLEEENRLVLALEDDEGHPLEGADVHVVAYPADGEAADASWEMEDQGEGRYIADPLDFPAPGEWRVVAEVTPPGEERPHEVTHTVRVAGSPSALR